MVTGIAAIHYFYMRGVWIATNESPTVFRYVDWLLTVPLQIVEFYLILAAIAVVRAALFWKLLLAYVVSIPADAMLAVGASFAYFLVTELSRAQEEKHALLLAEA